jgi:TetR/AcrR family transcriptional regulator
MRMNENLNNSKNTIFECALTLFSERGYEATGVAEIAEAAHIKKPTLYYFFGSKEGLFQAILDEYYRLLNDRLKAAAVYRPNSSNYYNDVYPVLLRLAGVYFDFYREYSAFYLLMLSLNFAPHTSKSAQLSLPYNKEQFEIITRLFYDISKVHANVKSKEPRIARHFVAMLNADIAFHVHGACEMNEVTAANLVKEFMHGIFS